MKSIWADKCIQMGTDTKTLPSISTVNWDVQSDGCGVKIERQLVQLGIKYIQIQAEGLPS